MRALIVAVIAMMPSIGMAGELEDAQWFTPGEILEKRVMPTNHSISYRLISDWLAERSRGPAL